jgi:cell division cycle 20-like protein 1 (cofactor of APC complex)
MHSPIAGPPPQSPFMTSPVGTDNPRSPMMSPRPAPRKITRQPVKVLDAPGLQDDFYLNLLDWSAQNVLAVGLASCVYLWSATTSKVRLLGLLGRGGGSPGGGWRG